MEHNKLSSLRGGTMGKFPCHLCSTTRNNLASLGNVPFEKMTKGSKMKHIRSHSIERNGILCLSKQCFI